MGYQPAQHFAIKVPRAYHHLPAAVQQLQSDIDYYQISYAVLQHEHQLLSRMADCSGVLRSFAYGVVKYGPGGMLQLPCLLLELAEGSVQQMLEQQQQQQQQQLQYSGLWACPMLTCGNSCTACCLA
jgi:hypothetical protein